MSSAKWDLSDKDQRSIISYHIQKEDNQRVQSTVAVDLIPTPSQWRFEKHDDGWIIQNRRNWEYLDTDKYGMSSVTVGESSLQVPTRSGTLSETVDSKATGKDSLPRPRHLFMIKLQNSRPRNQLQH